MTVKPNTVEDYIEAGCGRCEFGNTPNCKVHNWTAELRLLRDIINETALEETIKWSSPCYTFAGNNVLMLGALKDSTVLGFLRGAELEDPHNLLEKPGEKSEQARYLRFTSTEDVKQLKNVIIEYIEQAIVISQQPKPKIQPKEIDYPEELIQAFENDPVFMDAFNNLTPGRQRSHLIHYNSAKQSKTITNRIQKSRNKVFSGKGWNEY